MARKGSWKDQSLKVINEAYFQLKKENPELSDADIIKRVSKEYYPFGEREYYPYQAWMSAIKDWKTALGIVKTEAVKGETLPLFS